MGATLTGHITERDETKLFENARDGLLEPIKHFFENYKGHPARIFQQKDYTGRTILHCACYEGQEKIVQFLIERLIENRLNFIDNKDEFGHTPLILACVKGYPIEAEEINSPSKHQKKDVDATNAYRTKIVSMLLEQGASLRIYKNTNNPLHWACYHGDIELIKVLLQRFWFKKHHDLALVFQQNADKLFPIDMIQYCERKDEVAEILLSTQLNSVSIGLLKEVLGTTDVAHSLLHADSNEELKANKNDDDHVALHEKTPCYVFKPFSFIPKGRVKYAYRMMYWAAYLDKLSYMRLLMDIGVSPFVMSSKYKNALIAAIQEGQLKAVKLLCRVNYVTEPRTKESLASIFEFMVDQDANTPLHMAVRRVKRGSPTVQNDREIVQELLDAKHPLNCYNVRGWRPFEMSRTREMRELENKADSHEMIGKIDKVSSEEEFKKVASRFQYCIVAPIRDTVEYNILYIQLTRIRDRYKREGDATNRGRFEFAYTECFNNKKKMIFLLRANPPLLNETAEKMGLLMFNQTHRFIEVFNQKRSPEFERFRGTHIKRIILELLKEEFEIESFKRSGIIEQDFPLHNYTERAEIRRQWRTPHMIKSLIIDSLVYIRADHDYLRPFTTIAFYFGTRFAWYLSFVSLFAADLFIPAILFMGFGIYNQYDESRDNNTVFVPFLCIVISLWATTFAEKWKRRENQLAYLWDMHKFKENEQIRARFRGSHTIDSVTKDIVKWNRLSTIKRRYLIEIPLTAFGVALIIGIFYLFLVIAQNESVQNSDTYTVAAGIANGVLIVVANELYAYLVRAAVEWENHKFESSNDNSLIIKIFAFQFVNSYIQLFYYAFFNPTDSEDDSFSLVSNTMLSLFISKGIIQLAKRNIVPNIQFRIQNRLFSKKFDRVMKDKEVEFHYSAKDVKDHGIEDSDPEKTKRKRKYLLKQIEQQRTVMSQGQALNDEYAYTIIMFGYIAMFSPAYPFAPLMGMVWNFLKLVVDVNSVSVSKKRTNESEADSIGAWNQILEFIAFASLIVNGLFVFITSHQLHSLLSRFDLTENFQEDLAQLIIIAIAEHVVFGLKFAINVLIPDTPQWIRENLEEQDFREKKIVLERTLQSNYYGGKEGNQKIASS